MRLALLNTQPQISQLAAHIKVNHHIEHKSLNANKYMQYNLVLIFTINLEKRMRVLEYVKKILKGVTKQKR